MTTERRPHLKSHVDPADTSSVGSETTPDHSNLEHAEHELSVFFHRMKHRLRNAVGQSHSELQVVGHRILTTLRREGPCTPGSLADGLDLDRSIVSRQIRLLQQLGLIALEINPADKRGRICTLTAEGIGVLRSSHSYLFAPLQQLSPKDAADLARILGSLNQRLLDT